METQQDSKVRMVALTNLRAMCARISGMSHRFTVEKVTRSRVHVAYSNPDEYGSEAPVTAVFPLYPSGSPDDADNPRVVLDSIRYFGGRDEEDWQAFHQLLDCPTLWRVPGLVDDAATKNGVWHTHAEIVKRCAAAGDPMDHTRRERDTCTVCDLPKEWRKAS